MDPTGHKSAVVSFDFGAKSGVVQDIGTYATGIYGNIKDIKNILGGNLIWSGTLAALGFDNIRDQNRYCILYDFKGVKNGDTVTAQVQKRKSFLGYEWFGDYKKIYAVYQGGNTALGKITEYASLYGYSGDVIIDGKLVMENSNKWGVPLPDLLFERDTEQGIWYSPIDVLQKHGGYNDMYDAAFRVACDYRKFISEFKYGGYTWRVEAWKGNYLNMGVGAEIGMYYKNNNSFANKAGHFVAVDKYNMLYMQFTLFNDKPSKNNQIFSRERQKHWWLNGFKPGIGKIPSEKLVMVGSITFKSEVMAKEFIKGLKDVEGNLVKNRKGATVNFTWK